MSRKQWWINWNGVNTCFIRLLIILINSGNPMFPDPVASASANISSSCSEETNTPTTIGKYQQSFIYPRKSKRSEGFVMVHWRMWGELDVEKYLPILWLHLKMKHIMDVWWVIKWLMHDWWLEMNCKCPKILIGRYCRRKKHLPTPNNHQYHYATNPKYKLDWEIPNCFSVFFRVSFLSTPALAVSNSSKASFSSATWSSPNTTLDSSLAKPLLFAYIYQQQKEKIIRKMKNTTITSTDHHKSTTPSPFS